MTVLVSFCVFGKDQNLIYGRGAIRNAELYALHYPDWKLRFYLGRTAAYLSAELSRFSQVECEVIDLPENQTSTGWRFLALRDRQYSHYFFRDTDSRPIVRERTAVAEFIQLRDKQFHVIRDHPFHGVPILAGLWGCAAVGADQIRHLIPDQLKDDYYQVDQDFLKHKIWPIARRSVLQHVDCEYDFGLPVEPLSGSWQDEGFVGQGFLGDDKPRHPLHSRILVG